MKDGVYMSIEIRRATKDDVENVIVFCKQVGSETDNLSYGSEGIGSNIERISKYLDDVYNSDKAVFLIAISDNKIVGYAEYSSLFRKRLSHRGDMGIAVLKNYQGKGIGSHLMKELIDYVKNEIKAEIISLEVRTDNQIAINLYKNNGFEKIGFYKGFMKINDKYIDCDLMNLYLNK
jgi:ribosomal protein S18 acetylase RimI-like enzyme